MPEPTVAEDEKRCPKCGETKPLDDFHRNKRETDGRNRLCRVCMKAAAADWYQRNKEKAAARVRRWRAENPDRVKAHNAHVDKAVRREQNRRWVEANRERKRETDRRWSRENRDKQRERAARFRRKYPEKYKARVEVMKAVAAGRLIQPGHCENCGGTGQPFEDGRSPIQAHHPDYSRPLDVEWLCLRCHVARHSDQPD